MKQSALILLIFLASCTTPQRTAAPADLNANVLYTQATSTAQAEAVSGTQQAMVATKDEAAKNAQITMLETAVSGTATRSFSATSSAIVAATATTGAFNREQIELEALTTRRHAETVATVESIAIETTREYNRQRREEWSRDFGIGILLVLLAVAGSGLGMMAWREAWTLRDKSGEVIGYRGEIFLPENEPTIIEQPQALFPSPRPFAVRHRGGFVAVEETREPFKLTGRDGSIAHIFSGKVLDDMQTNLENGDRGFRRDSTAHTLGMDKLAELNGNGYKKVLDAMKVMGFVELEAGNNRWTTHGAVTVLGLASLPQQ